jgi:hypothetical protein
MIRSRLTLTALFLLLVSFFKPDPAWSQESPFPVLPGLEGAVEFWKKIFTRFSTSQVVFHDPHDPALIYSVVTIPENDQARAAIDNERARIMAEYDQKEEEGRVRSQRGVK